MYDEYIMTFTEVDGMIAHNSFAGVLLYLQKVQFCRIASSTLEEM